MSKKRARELIEEWLDKDRRECDDFKSEFQFRHPPLEDRLGFAEFRLKMWGGAFRDIFTELAADDEPSRPSAPGEEA